MQLSPVPGGLVPEVWPHVAPWIERACRRQPSDLTADGLRDLCVEQRALLVLILSDERPVAVGVTQVRDHQDGTRSCWVLTLAGGRAGAWIEVMDQVEAGARRNGCHRIEFVGRPGWARLLPGFAAETHFTKVL